MWISRYRYPSKSKGSNRINVELEDIILSSISMKSIIRMSMLRKIVVHLSQQKMNWKLKINYFVRKLMNWKLKIHYFVGKLMNWKLKINYFVL